MNRVYALSIPNDGYSSMERVLFKMLDLIKFTSMEY